MAIDPELTQQDMYLGTVGEFDVRVVREGWTYYVQATKRPFELGRRSRSSGDLLGDLLIVLPVELFLSWRTRKNPWTVGVVRMGYVGGWNEPRPRVVHCETLPAGHEPQARISQLVTAVNAGQFHPER